MIARCCQQLHTWIAQGTEPLHIHLNVSARQLYDSPLAEQLSEELQRAEVPANLLTLELTETAIIADHGTALTTLRQLAELGVRIALDDYGTGFASLAYLNSYPFDTIKLDSTLIRGLGHSTKDDIIATSSVEMSHALGLTVIAEGVETTAQDRLLTSIGCDYGQGYLYGRPGTVSELRATRLPSRTHQRTARPSQQPGNNGKPRANKSTTTVS